METAIVIVEDDANLRRSYARIIAKEGYDVIEVDNVQAAYALRREPIAGLLVDYVLPDGFGTDLIRDLREGGVSAPILLVTAHPSLALADEAAAAGASFHAKPVSQAAIQSLLDAARPFVPVDIRLRKALVLTKRQHDVVRVRVEGVPRAGIAAALDVPEDTVKSRIREILKKARKHGYADDRLDDLIVDAERRWRQT
jgi:FixJ family two-component response regulator